MECFRCCGAAVLVRITEHVERDTVVDVLLKPIQKPFWQKWKALAFLGVGDLT